MILPDVKPLQMFAGAALLAIIALGVVVVRDGKRRSMEAQQASASQNLAVETANALDAYYRTNGAYPKRLQDLPTNLFQFHDGGSPGMLQRFRYSSDGRAYEFAYDSKWAFHVSRTGLSAAVWLPRFPPYPPSK